MLLFILHDYAVSFSFRIYDIRAYMNVVDALTSLGFRSTLAGRHMRGQMMF